MNLIPVLQPRDKIHYCFDSDIMYYKVCEYYPIIANGKLKKNIKYIKLYQKDYYCVAQIKKNKATFLCVLSSYC